MKKILLFLVALIATHATYALCTAAFTFVTASTNNDLLKVTVTNTSTYSAIPSGQYEYVAIDFGDGTPRIYNGTYQTAYEHSYATPGTYNVKVIAMIADSINSSNANISCSDSITQSVMVSHTACATSVTINRIDDSTFSFAANTPAGTSGMSYTWNFGDGNTGTGASVSHAYRSNNMFNVVLTATSTSPSCTYTNTQQVYVNRFSCNGTNASFTTSVSNSMVTITNTSTEPGGQHYSTYNYTYGDGSTTTTNSVHTYTAAGTYTIFLQAIWTDTNNSSNICTDTFSHTVTVTGLVNKIVGEVRNDSLPSVVDTIFKVWLIAYDSAAGTLTAVDSVLTNLYPNSAPFEFYNPAPGKYLLKAAQVSASPVFIPTYSWNTPYWSSAQQINYTYGLESGYISMIPGTPGAGPGFIGGSISAGANRLGRRTGNDVTDVLMLLRDNAGKPIAATRTDADGKYYFGNIPAGNYDIYPELPGYTTIVFHVSVVPGHDTVSNIDFHINTTTKTIAPKPAAIAKVINVPVPAIYPNPTTGVINIQGLQAGENNIVVTDVTGRVVLQTQTNNTATTINLSAINPGIYFINIKADEVNYSTRIIVNK